jgi:hypothetical protein
MIADKLDPNRFFVTAKKISGKRSQLWIYEKRTDGIDYPVHPVDKDFVKPNQQDQLGKEQAERHGIPFIKKPNDTARVQRREKILAKNLEQQKQQKERSENIKRWTKQWLEKHPSKELAIVEALRILNRWAKRLSRHNENELRLRRLIYHMKDSWIRSNQHHLVYGQKVRLELSMGCCKYDEYPRSWLLYSHTFNIQGTEINFHSYSKPERLIQEKGEDLPSYGVPITDEEIKELGIDLNGLIEVVTWRLATQHRNSAKRQECERSQPDS